MIKDIKGITSDSRAVQKGYLFAALSGTRFDGRNFIEQAVLNGATHVLAGNRNQIPRWYCLVLKVITRTAILRK